jgi:hypothetical protein
MVTEFQPGDVLWDEGMWFSGSGRLTTKSVYLGHDRKFDCQLAIDVFASNKPIMPEGLTVSAWEAGPFLGRLGDHPNIASVVDHWEDNKDWRGESER